MSGHTPGYRVIAEFPPYLTHSLQLDKGLYELPDIAKLVMLDVLECNYNFNMCEKYVAHLHLN